MTEPTLYPISELAAAASVRAVGSDSTRWSCPRVRIEKRRNWGSMSVAVVSRAAGETTCRSDHYRLTYFLTDFQGTIQDDERPEWNCELLRGNFMFCPPDTTLRCNLTAGRYIEILQSRDIYADLASELVRGGLICLAPRYDLCDPLISRLASTIADEIEGGVLDRILADALSTALALQIMRICGDPSEIGLAIANGLSPGRVQRVRDYIEAHLDNALTLSEMAEVACLSPYHFSRSFKRATGVGVHRYVIQRRIERAKALLRRTNQPLAGIARETGFADQSHLTSVFHRETGVTPGQFRAAAL